MEPHSKRSRHENGGFGLNPRSHWQKEWGFFQQSNGGGDLECRRFNTPEGCPFGSTCRFRHVPADGGDVGPQGLSGGKPKPCMKFFRSGIAVKAAVSLFHQLHRLGSEKLMWLSPEVHVKEG